ncbi:MAG: hypothetical protein JKY84_01510 [Emcibacteraceae bacterium]|nr:hypothetical protein [Emcibacteraceae bacterium]
MALQSAIINVMEKAVKKAGIKLARDFGEVENLQVSAKAPQISSPALISALKEQSSKN